MDDQSLLAPISFSIIYSSFGYNIKIATSKGRIFIFFKIFPPLPPPLPPPPKIVQSGSHLFRMVHLYCKVAVRMYRRAGLNWLTAEV